MPRSTPNYLTIDANGRVTALFSGGVQTLAVIPPGAAPVSSRSFSWIRDGDALVPAFMQGGTNLPSPQVNPGGNLQLVACDPPFNGSAPFRYASVFIDAATGASPSPEAKVLVQAAGKGGSNTFAQRRIIDDEGNSDFVQITGANGVTLKKLAMAAGSTGAITNGTAAAFPTGLSSLSQVVAQPQQIGNVGQGGWNCDHGGGPGAFTIYNNTGFTIPFDWIAIGVV